MGRGERPPMLLPIGRQLSPSLVVNQVRQTYNLLEMAKVSETNKYLADKVRRDAMIHRNVIQSSIFEGIYHVTEADLEKPLEVPKKRLVESEIQLPKLEELP